MVDGGWWIRLRPQVSSPFGSLGGCADPSFPLCALALVPPRTAGQSSQLLFLFPGGAACLCLPAYSVYSVRTLSGLRFPLFSCCFLLRRLSVCSAICQRPPPPPLRLANHYPPTTFHSLPFNTKHPASYKPAILFSPWISSFSLLYTAGIPIQYRPRHGPSEI